MEDVTQILQAAGSGDPAAAAKLMPLVYEDLRKVAAAKMARLSHGQTLQATALVHEAYLRMFGDDKSSWEAAAQAMQCFLIDQARKKGRRKRGGEWQRVELKDLDLATDADSETLLIVQEALEKLAEKDAIKAELVRLRFYIGLSNDEAVKVLGISEATGKRYWSFARAWLMQEISEAQSKE